MKHDVAVVIVTYNSEDHIAACLESVFAQRRSVRQQVIVVDNASRDGTVALIKEQFPEVELLLPGKNLGFAAGVNYGAKHSQADYVLLLNPDTIVRDHAVDVVIEFARKHPEYAIYGGRTLKPDGSLEPSSCWGQPGLWSMTLFAFGLTTIAPRNRWLDPESLGNWQRDSVREVGVITGCFLLAEKSAWEKLGGMDERYFMYGEDVDFSMRARREGYRPVICPDAVVVHEVGSCSDTPVHKTLLLYKGKASLVHSHWKGIGKWWGLLLLRSGTGLRAFLSKTVLGKRGDASAGDRWITLWRQRDQWIQGYNNQPSATRGTPETPTPAAPQPCLPETPAQ